MVLLDEAGNIGVMGLLPKHYLMGESLGLLRVSTLRQGNNVRHVVG